MLFTASFFSPIFSAFKAVLFFFDYLTGVVNFTLSGNAPSLKTAVRSFRVALNPCVRRDCGKKLGQI